MFKVDCWKEEKELYRKPTTVLHETIRNFGGNFVAPKSVDNFQLRNHRWEVTDPTEEDEKEMRGVTHDSTLRTQCLKLTGRRRKQDVMRREGGGSLTIKALHSITKRRQLTVPSKQHHINEHGSVPGDTSLKECGILAHIHAVVELEHLIFLSGETVKILHAYF